MKKLLFIIVVFLLLLTISSCQSPKPAALATTATPIPLKTTTIQATSVGQANVGTFTIYIYKDQQLSMSYNSSIFPATLKVTLPDKSNLMYYHTSDSLVVGQLSSSTQSSEKTGRFVYQCKVNGFYTFEFTTPKIAGNTTYNSVDIQVSYETR
jgi:hypothetical protein